MEASSDEVKEVYARFGLAYYYGEVLHRGLCILYAFSRVPEEGGMTRPRWDEHMSHAFSSTLGQIVKDVMPVLPEDLVPAVEAATDRRNFLAHRFWYERIHLLTTSEGVSQLIGELSAYVETFQVLNAQIERCVEPCLSRAGVTDEKLEESLRCVLRGEDDGPIIRQRRPKKQEVVVAVYEAPTEGGWTLILQTDEGALWQLCDAGLGWTAYDQVEAGWRQPEAFRGLLPAQINPRPPVQKPWHFEIAFGPGAALVVSPGRERGQFRWRIRRGNTQGSCK